MAATGYWLSPSDSGQMGRTTKEVTMGLRRYRAGYDWFLTTGDANDSRASQHGTNRLVQVMLTYVLWESSWHPGENDQAPQFRQDGILPIVFAHAV
jgi:hypothetical protein